MAISRGYTKYADDRSPATVEMIADTDSESKKKWHEVTRVDANQVTKSYLFAADNYAEFTALIERHDAEFKAWMQGGASA